MNGHDIKLMKFKAYLDDKINTHLFIACKTTNLVQEKHNAIIAELGLVRDTFINQCWREGR